MIIVDFHQVMISNIMIHFNTNWTRGLDKSELDEGLVRHMILNSLRSINNKWKRDYGNLVIAYDSKNSWRKQIFPYYKASRRKAQKESPIDWVKLFEYFGRIKPELKEVLPYKVIEVEKCEADDIIACLVRHFQKQENILIVSGDKDFIQLHNEAVQQYDPVRKKKVTNGDPKKFLFDHILRGDAGDGIPNVLSDDDTFVNPDKRQKPLTWKRINSMTDLFGCYKLQDEKIDKNFCRNTNLIDLTMTPEELVIKVMEDYANHPHRDKQKLCSYLMQKDCRYLLENIQDF